MVGAIITKNKVLKSENSILIIELEYSFYKKTELFFKGKCIIGGLLWFHCEFNYEELKVILAQIEMTESQISPFSEKDLNNFAMHIDTDKKLPLFEVLMMFTSNSFDNLSVFNKVLINHEEYLKLEDRGEQIFFIYDQIYRNKESLLARWNNISKLETKWLFSNGNLVSKYSNVNKIANFMFISSNDIFELFDINTSLSFESLYAKITNNKHVVFEKELKQLIRENLFKVFSSSKKSENIILNFPFFAKINTLFEMNIQDIKSLKELNEYLEILNQISLKTDDVFILKKTNLKNHILTFTSLFEENQLTVLRKTNIPYHLIEGNISMINNYYQNNKKLSVKKESKLYYFLAGISKKLTEMSPIENLQNPNQEMNNEIIHEENELFKISTISNTKELWDIGIELMNCAGNLETLDYYKKRFNYKIECKKTDKKFLGAIHDGKFDQLKGFKNESPSFELFLSVFDLLLKNNYINNDNCSSMKQIYDKNCIHTIFID